MVHLRYLFMLIDKLNDTYTSRQSQLKFLLNSKLIKCGNCHTWTIKYNSGVPSKYKFNYSLINKLQKRIAYIMILYRLREHGLTIIT